MNQRMMHSDVPLNLTATSLVANAYMYSGEPKYRTWIEQYVTAGWSEPAATTEFSRTTWG